MAKIAKIMVRLTEEDLVKLKARAGDIGVSEYVRTRILNDIQASTPVIIGEPELVAIIRSYQELFKNKYGTQ